MNTLSFNQEICEKYSVDLLIAGGGPAGIAAALTAARRGHKVMIVDMQYSLGGAGTVGMVPAFMQFGDGINFLAAGIGEEVLEKLKTYGGTGQYGTYGISTEVLKRVYDDMIVEAGIELIMGAHIIGVKKVDKNISHVVIAAKSGIYAISAKMFVDGTGDGDVCAMAGAEFEIGNEEKEMMPGTLCSFWTDVDWAQVSGRQDSMLEEAFKEDIFEVQDLHLSGIYRTGETVGGGNIGHCFGVNPLDEVSLTKAFMQQRKRLLEYKEYYRKFLKGFNKVELAGTAAMMGIRESRRIIGDYVLNLADFKSRAVFDDEIGRYCYPVDIHSSKPDVESFRQFEKEFKKQYRYNKGESYGIPYRVLTPLGLDNVLTAGRCISCDRYILGSIRVMPGCYITGQASGMAASLAIENNITTREVNIKSLQEELLGIGAYIPNTL